ncbi:hypothetical protein CH306_23065 [Rhodococcus sp. 15-725-2-2b]|nr:hypothetical protein NY08_1303 [Rhodococcus sp. B7740]OZC61037.1 hypothetical protein CH276_17390 [Rhodococcus sp. 06-470-2]OZC71767.1 hypothetical protein CH277_04500 [Rhodococcus sp. 06-469-3-2]OZC82837.1 hypothetical protein CH274_07515 [Rhodococcus sp. 06-418-5]OZD42556.1 hypothetical protein CH264_21915 [Rhodococcus sp. 06-1477-1A]OZD77723.1 hypothetical protein CH273_20115 [Rhodococcus sp. 05-339-2]OZE06001.1 hypothetical protein CH249_23115 [Rhodococcus sp. 05-2255-3B1]OZE09210.1 h
MFVAAGCQDRRTRYDTVRGDTVGALMFWKILGFIVLIWIALALLGSIIKGLFWLVVAGAIVMGLVWLYKAIASDNDRSSLKF